MRTRELFTREENSLMDYIDILEDRLVAANRRIDQDAELAEDYRQRIAKRNRAARDAKRRETELKGTITRLLYLIPHYTADLQRAREVVGEEAWARFLASVARSWTASGNLE